MDDILQDSPRDPAAHIFQDRQSGQLVAQHRLQSRAEGWVSLPGHHTRLWQDTIQVEQRPLEAYEEATTWKS